ncbi:PPC domain-containing DNA-binding protein [Verrucomicrobiota bacterium]
METMKYDGQMEVVVVRLDPDENLLGSVEKAIVEHDIRNGVVLSGIATLKRCEMHYVEHTDFPPDNTFHTVEKPLEVGSISGIIADGKPHLHIVVGCRDSGTWVGHVESDCIIGYLAELCILKFPGLEMARHFNEQRGISQLGAK